MKIKCSACGDSLVGMYENGLISKYRINRIKDSIVIKCKCGEVRKIKLPKHLKFAPRYDQVYWEQREIEDMEAT